MKKLLAISTIVLATVTISCNNAADSGNTTKDTTVARDSMPMKPSNPDSAIDPNMSSKDSSASKQ